MEKTDDRGMIVNNMTNVGWYIDTLQINNATKVLYYNLLNYIYAYNL